MTQPVNSQHVAGEAAGGVSVMGEQVNEAERGWCGFAVARGVGLEEGDIPSGWEGQERGRDGGF